MAYEYKHYMNPAQEPCDRNNCRCGGPKNCMFYNNTDPSQPDYSVDDYFAVQGSDRSNVVPNNRTYIDDPQLGTNDVINMNGPMPFMNMDYQMGMMKMIMPGVILAAMLVAAIIFYRKFGFPNIKRDYLVIGAVAALVFFLFFFPRRQMM